MPSYLRQPSDAVCWNCDRRDDALVITTLRSPAGAARTFRLCRACEDVIYPALVQVAADAGIEIVHGAPGYRIAS